VGDYLGHSMAIVLIHLSDIHFGQERGGRVFIHDDVKERLIEDVRRQVSGLPGGRAVGIIVTGDIAYAGRIEEYKQAGEWLDRLAEAAGCAITDIQVVPGNHDIDRDNISPATVLMLNEIVQGGEDKLDQFLANDRDREMLYARFTAYRPFAEGYDEQMERCYAQWNRTSVDWTMVEYCYKGATAN